MPTEVVLWGIVPEAYRNDVARVPMRLTSGPLAAMRATGADYAARGWRELVLVPEGGHALDVATCGTCHRAWDARRHPTPAMLCPFCNGDEDAARPWRCYPVPDPRTARDVDEATPDALSAPSGSPLPPRAARAVAAALEALRVAQLEDVDDEAAGWLRYAVDALRRATP